MRDLSAASILHSLTLIFFSFPLMFWRIGSNCFYFSSNEIVLSLEKSLIFWTFTAALALCSTIKIIYSILDNSNTDISKYHLISRIIISSNLIFFHFNLPFNSNYWYLIVNFLGPENLLWDMSNLRWISTLSYRKTAALIFITLFTML